MNEIATAAENTLVTQKKAILQLIPESKFNKFRTFVANASLTNEDLNNATSASITKAFLDCAKTGLMPDGSEAAIVTRFDKKIGYHVASFQPMVKGVVKIINESQTIKSFHVKTVYEGEDFDVYSDELGDHLKYKQNFDVERTDNNIKLFYACAVLENGAVIIEVMTKKQVDKHKASAKTPYVWNNWYSEMGIKTIIHRAIKRLPIEIPEIVSGLESSLDIDLSNGEAEQKPKKRLFKSREHRQEYIFGIVQSINNDDKNGVSELYLELEQEQQMDIWREFSTKQKTYIREAIAVDAEKELIEQQ